MAKRKSADSGDPIENPHDRDKALSVAYLRMIGLTQVDAAKSAGVGERTIRDWEKCSWWPEVQAEARHRWLNDLMDASRATLLKSIKAGGFTEALTILERMDPDFRPAPQEHRIGILGMIQTLPPEEVRRLQALPIEERRNQLKLLTNGNGRA